MNTEQKKIVDIWVTLPAKQRVELYKLLATGVNVDADNLSTGRSESLDGYDLLISGPAPEVVHSESKIMGSNTHIKAE